MFRRARPQLLMVSAVGRWVLALLTLLAALAHLTRSPAAGGLGLSLTALAVTTAPSHATSAEMHAAAHATVMPDCMSGMPAGARPTAHAGHGATPSLTDAAPNAPPAYDHHHSDAHCPFCFTAAFALEAETVTARAEISPATPTSTNVALPLAIAVVRHADPRAPPTSRTEHVSSLTF